jgi:hypothetical protein
MMNAEAYTCFIARAPAGTEKTRRREEKKLVVSAQKPGGSSLDIGTFPHEV